MWGVAFGISPRASDTAMVIIHVAEDAIPDCQGADHRSNDPPELWPQRRMLAAGYRRHLTPVSPKHLIQVLDATKDRSYSLKLDGVRVLAFRNEGTVVLRLRTGVDITARFRMWR